MEAIIKSATFKPGKRLKELIIEKVNKLLCHVRRTSFKPLLSFARKKKTVIAVKKNDLAVIIGNINDTGAYKTSVFNIRIRNRAVKLIGNNASHGHAIYSENGNIYDLAQGDRVFHVSPEYIGCRTKNRGFDAEKFGVLARDTRIKAIELDLSKPLRPFHDLISTTGNYISTQKSKTVLPTLGSSVFSDAEGMVMFLERLHNLAGGKPVGIKLRIENKKELYNICYAIKKVKFSPHFMVIVPEQQTGFCSPGLRPFNARSLYELIIFTSKTLEVYELDKKIKIIAAANIRSGADLLRLLSLGADAVWSEAPGNKIIKMNSNGGVEYLVYKDRHVAEFQNYILGAAARIMEANGLATINDITLSTFFRWSINISK